MRARHFILVACIFAAQCALTALTILWQNSSLDWVAGGCWYGSWLIPFVGDIAVLHCAPLLAAQARVLRTAIFTVVSLVATIGGALLFIAICMSLGIPLRQT